MIAHEFDSNFKALTGHDPFPWQRRLFGFLSAGELPSGVDIPTGLGKTAVMALWLLARARGAPLPRRLVYVVDRRAVVDQATDFAETLRRNLRCDALEPVRQGLGLRAGRELPISTLRGQHADNREWLEDPAAAAIIVGTVDMIGSRLLFEGYGVSRRMRPNAAGLLGCDALAMLDEAHLAHPFQRLLQTIEKEQGVCPNADDASARGIFAGSASSSALPPPFRVLPLSATLGAAEGASQSFELCAEDLENPTLRARLEAAKRLTVEPLDNGAKLEDALAGRAWSLAHDENGGSGRPTRMLVYCDSRKIAENVKKNLDKRGKTSATGSTAILLVGARRLHEREKAAQELGEHGYLADRPLPARPAPVFLVATSAGEVGIDLDADGMICDLVPWERMVQRLGRVNRRGKGEARVVAIDQGSPDEKKFGGSAARRHKAVRELVERLPRTDSGGWNASPRALSSLGEDPALQEPIHAASTPPPLHPPLSRPLVDAWAMTSLGEHTGRPEVGPWLRGWVDEEPQTVVIWRRCLPVRYETGTRAVHPRSASEIEAFFEAAPPHSSELLETDTGSVVDWLVKRARKLLTGHDANGAERPEPEEEAVDGAGEEAASADLAPLNGASPVLFFAGGATASRIWRSLDLADICKADRKRMTRDLAGSRIVVDARLCGLSDGLLAPQAAKAVPTAEDNWGKDDPGKWEESPLASRIRILSDERRRSECEKYADPSHPWREALAMRYRLSPEGEAASWLVVEKLRSRDGGEDARAIGARPQKLDEHHAWVGEEARRIAAALGLCRADSAMLEAAARRHDDGKKAPRWQRAFNAEREGGPYAKTAGPVNRHILNGFRHEFQSALDAEKRGLDGVERSDPRFDLALHLIAAHHGNARPSIAVEGCDALPPSAAAREAHEIGLRFARQQRLWGPWGLAWWEALLRAADRRASQRLDDEAAPASPGAAPSPRDMSSQGDLFAAGGGERV